MRANKLLKRVLVIGALACEAIAFAQPTPPPQPTSGPGGSNYEFGAVTTNGPYWANNRTTNNSYKYYTFEPADPTPVQAPVILFVHGVFALTPSSYQAWINHMVRKGYVVVWVQFQATALTSPNQYTANAIASWSDALYRLQNFWWENHVRPLMGPGGEPENMIVGHSVGAWTAANIAALVKTSTPTIPLPWAIVAIEPGTKGLVPGADYSQINPNTVIVDVVGDEDTVACSGPTLRIWGGTPQVSKKNLLWVRSDTHGSPQQLGNHYFPGTSGFNDTAAIDDRDYNITWKLSVATAECVFGNSPDPNACTYALGAGNPLQVSLGNWSDGVPVKPMVWYANASQLPAIPGCP